MMFKAAVFVLVLAAIDLALGLLGVTPDAISYNVLSSIAR